jgi:hypothetical protein
MLTGSKLASSFNSVNRSWNPPSCPSRPAEANGPRVEFNPWERDPLHDRLKDPRGDDPQIVELRELHREMDRTVLAANGWPDIVVPSCTTPETDAERRVRESFEDEVIDRRPRKAKNEGQGGLFD